VLLSYAIIKYLPFVWWNQESTYSEEGQLLLALLKHILREQKVSLQNLSNQCEKIAFVFFVDIIMHCLSFATLLHGEVICQDSI
jgi:hypothetical protein